MFKNMMTLGEIAKELVDSSIVLKLSDDDKKTERLVSSRKLDCFADDFISREGVEHILFITVYVLGRFHSLYEKVDYRKPETTLLSRYQLVKTRTGGVK